MRPIDQLAEHLANGKSVEAASRLMGVSVDKGGALFRQICRELGPQAR